MNPNRPMTSIREGMAEPRWKPIAASIARHLNVHLAQQRDPMYALSRRGEQTLILTSLDPAEPNVEITIRVAR